MLGMSIMTWAIINGCLSLLNYMIYRSNGKKLNLFAAIISGMAAISNILTILL